MQIINPQVIAMIIAQAEQLSLILGDRFQTVDEILSAETSSSPADSRKLIPAQEFHDHIIYQDLEKLINSLSRKQQELLTALMWLGRGDYSIGEWRLALCRGAYYAARGTASYLLATPELSHYLKRGLELYDSYLVEA